MPLSWWFSRSLKPDRGAPRTEVVLAVVPPFQVRVTQEATRRTLHSRPSAPSHPSALAACSPPPYSYDSSRCTASWRLRCFGSDATLAGMVRRTLDGLESDEHYGRTGSPRLSHPLPLLLFPPADFIGGTPPRLSVTTDTSRSSRLVLRSSVVKEERDT